MKKHFFTGLFLTLCFMHTPSYSYDNCAENCCEAVNCCETDCRLAIEGAIATEGVFSLGLTYYTPRYEIGFNGGGFFNDAHFKTTLFTPVVFAGLRNYIGCQTYFAYGVSGVANFGKINGWNIESSYSAEIYISLEYYLTQRLLLVGWINPYAYATRKLEHHSRVDTNYFFNTGGLGLAYFW